LRLLKYFEQQARNPIVPETFDSPLTHGNFKDRAPRFRQSEFMIQRGSVFFSHNQPFLNRRGEPTEPPNVFVMMPLSFRNRMACELLCRPQHVTNPALVSVVEQTPQFDTL
jgi:hypothetical protein